MSAKSKVNLIVISICSPLPTQLRSTVIMTRTLNLNVVINTKGSTTEDKFGKKYYVMVPFQFYVYVGFKYALSSKIGSSTDV